MTYNFVFTKFYLGYKRYIYIHTHTHIYIYIYIYITIYNRYIQKCYIKMYTSPIVDMYDVEHEHTS